MQAATSETKSKSLDLSICVHHYTLRAPCPKGQGNAIFGNIRRIITVRSTAVLSKTSHANCCTTLTNRPSRGRRGRFVRVVQQLACEVFERTAVLYKRLSPEFVITKFRRRWHRPP